MLLKHSAVHRTASTIKIIWPYMPVLLRLRNCALARCLKYLPNFVYLILFHLIFLSVSSFALYTLTHINDHMMNWGTESQFLGSPVYTILYTQSSRLTGKSKICGNFGDLIFEINLWQEYWTHLMANMSL